MSISENNAETSGQSDFSTEAELDLDALYFPPDIDWSTTLVLRCDPTASPYKTSDIYTALYSVVRRNTVFNLGPTTLSHAFILSFKTNSATEGFLRFLKNRKDLEIMVKKHPCQVLRVPTKGVTISVRWIPIEVDSAHVLDVLKQFGTIVKTELIQSNMRGWFHVYTNERKFTLLLNKDIHPNDLPFGIDVKGIFGAVHVLERNPRCLECYYSGHAGDNCKYDGCPLFRGS